MSDMSNRKRQLAFNYHPAEEVAPGVWFCEKLKLYWCKGITYDELGAMHNGVIGPGAQLRAVAKRIQDQAMKRKQR